MTKQRYIRHFLLVASVFALMVSGAHLLSLLVRNHFSDNYEWQAKQAMAKGNLKKAERILKHQMSAEHYDFTLHRLLAGVLMKRNRPSEAARLMQVSVERERAVSGRKVFNRGYNSYESHLLLSRALAAAGEDAAAESTSLRAKEKLTLQGVGILPRKNNS